MQDFHRLRVATCARRLAGQVYDLTDSFPRDERFGLTSQMRRAAVSIGANIAEGTGRYTNKEFASFLQIAMGSACELEFEALVALDLGFLSDAVHRELEKRLVGTKRELAALIARVRGLDPRSTLQQADKTTKSAAKKPRQPAPIPDRDGRIESSRYRTSIPTLRSTVPRNRQPRTLSPVRPSRRDLPAHQDNHAPTNSPLSTAVASSTSNREPMYSGVRW